METPPKISIVTPSFNQGQYLEETILSVLGQNYANMEYIIMDGGSSDNSVEIIKKYEKHLTHWVSEKDGGQASAINKGFEISTGDILCWLNSDDYFLPGTLQWISEKLDVSKKQMLLGNSFHFIDGVSDAWGSDVPGFYAKYNLKLYDYVIQPSSFWTRKTWEQTGNLNNAMYFAFDWDWYIRALNFGTEIMTTGRYLSSYRIHKTHKTRSGGMQRVNEIGNIYLKYSGDKYHKSYMYLISNKKRIQSFQKKIIKYKLSFLKPFLEKFFFDKTFLSLQEIERKSIIKMAGI